MQFPKLQLLLDSLNISLIKYQIMLMIKIQVKVRIKKYWLYFFFLNTVKPVYNGHPWDPKIEAVVDSWLLFRGSLYYTICN